MKQNITEFTLENNLKTIIIERKDLPLVSVNIAYKVGSKNESPNMTGFAHLFEHMMFEETTNLKKGDYDKYCALAGGSNNAYTIYDFTDYYLSLPNYELELGLWLEAERLGGFVVSESPFETQKKVVCEEILQTVENQPYARWREYLATAAYKANSPYSWEVHGKAEHVAKSTMESAREFHSLYYQPQNACLTICGGIDTAEAVKLVEKHFGGLKNFSRAPETLKFKEEDLIYGSKVAFDDNAPNPASFVSFHFPSMLSDSANAGDIITNIFSEGRSSRLYESLVRDQKIASHVGAYLDKRELSSLITFYAIASDSNSSPNDLENAILDEVNNFAQKGALDRELEKAKNNLRFQLEYEMQKAASIADHVATRAIFGESPETALNLGEKISVVENSEIKQLSNEYLKREKAIVVNVNSKS